MNKIDKMILAHSQWKYHLKQAIDTKQSQFTVEDTRDHEACELGKWLVSDDGKNVHYHSTISELHQLFHFEAANVLNFALTGREKEADTEMQFGGKFSDVSASLVNKLSQI